MTDQATSIISGTDSDQADVAAATRAAAEAFATYRATTPEQRGDFLEAVAAEIEADKETIIVEAVRESALPEARITGEVGRTTGQLRMFAGVVRRGDHLGVRIDPALPDRAPLPRADIRQRMVPLGPVAVFGASNFPLAFSTAGGDTASALAAGCPVVVKGHPAHPVHRHPRRPRHRPRRREVRPPRRHVLLRPRRRSRPARSSSRTRGSRPSASPAPAAAGSRSSRLRPRARSRSRSTPRCPRSTPWSSFPARSRRMVMPSPRRTSAA